MLTLAVTFHEVVLTVHILACQAAGLRAARANPVAWSDPHHPL